MNFNVTVDKRTELLGILLLISDYNKIFPHLIEELDNKEYRENIFNRFLQFKDDKTVKLFNKLINELNLCYDAPVSLFLQLNEDFTYNELEEYPFYNRLQQSNLVLEFLNELPEFARKINFEQFYNDNLAFYQEIIAKTRKDSNADQIMQFMQDFYKMDFNKNSFKVNLLPYTTNGNFGTTIKNEIGCNLGLKNYSKPFTFIKENDYGSMLLHEFSHSVINPLTDKNCTFEGEQFADIWEQMKNMAYASVDCIVNEHIIRAIQIFHLKNIIKTEDSITSADARLKRDLKNGFKYMETCVNSIEYYYNNIDKYSNFEEYYPEILLNIEKNFNNSLTANN